MQGIKSVIKDLFTEEAQDVPNILTKFFEVLLNSCQPELS